MAIGYTPIAMGYCNPPSQIINYSLFIIYTVTCRHKFQAVGLNL